MNQEEEQSFDTDTDAREGAFSSYTLGKIYTHWMFKSVLPCKPDCHPSFLSKETRYVSNYIRK